MRRVIQKDKTGCGIACIAMLSETSYKKVRLVAIHELNLYKNNKFLTHAKDLHNLGKRFGISLGKRRNKFKDFSCLPEKAILAINFRPKDNEWHWVVYHRTENDEYILDPIEAVKSKKRRDFRRLKETTKWWVNVSCK